MYKFICALIAALCISGAFASDVQVRTADGQTLQGEYLGTEDGVIKVRTKYGDLNVPSKDVVSFTKASDLPATPSTTAKSVPTDVSSDQVFPTPPDVNITALMTKRAPPPPEPTRTERTQLANLVSNLKNLPPKIEAKNLATLRNYGAMAYPFIAASYTDPLDLDFRIHLLSVLAEPNSPYTAGIFADTHATAWEVFTQAMTEPPTLPDGSYKVERVAIAGKRENLKDIASQVLTIEAYAAQAGGPYNTLLLFQIYKKRYSGEDNPLLSDYKRDAAFLLTAAADAKSSDAWTGADRVDMAERALPLLFKDKEALKAIAQAVLQRLLPSSHPKWSASQDEWFTWWAKHKDALEKK